MSKKSRYEIWFEDEPFYMASVSYKTFTMLLKTKAGIKRFRKLDPSVRAVTQTGPIMFTPLVHSPMSAAVPVEAPAKPCEQ